MNDELEPEILSYREFRNRQTLLAWEQRRRAFESQLCRGQLGSQKNPVGRDVDPVKRHPDDRNRIPPRI